MRILKTWTIPVFAAIALATAIHAGAHSGATGVVKERMEMMKAIGTNLKVLGAMVKGTATFDPQAARAAASAIAGHGAAIPAKFPDGPVTPPSEASEKIWTDWERFAALADDLAESAGQFADKAGSASSIDALKPDFGRIATTCKSCHEAFRIKKD